MDEGDSLHSCFDFGPKCDSPRWIEMTMRSVARPCSSRVGRRIPSQNWIVLVNRVVLERG